MMNEKRTVMLTLTVLLEVPIDNEDPFAVAGKTDSLLTSAIADTLGDLPDNLGWVSTRFTDLDDPDLNSGRCRVCGAWTTDREKSDPLMGLHYGVTVNGQLLCDDHLPQGHRWAF